MGKNKRSRTANAALNSATSFLYQMIRMVSLFVIPRLILSRFGSSYNGITNSITQFLGVVSLMSAGVGGVTHAALYKPLAEDDIIAVSRILKATEQFLRKIAVIFCGFLFAFGCIYPFIIRGQFEWLFTFSLIIIIGLSTVAEYCFGMTYRYLFQADQRMSVVNVINSIATAINVIIAVGLIKAGFGIHIVKLGSSLAFCINPIMLYVYAHKEYKIIKNVEPDNTSIKQRWDAFAHQVALFIHTNTDTMVLTFLATLREVSVYSVYNQVVNGVYTFLRCFFPSMDSAFGEMFARDEKKAIERNFAQFELIAFSVSTIMFSVTLGMIIPFISIYTRGVTDVDYNRPLFGYLLAIASYFFSIRVPYQNVIEAVGHYKQTKRYSYFEAALNLALSIILVFKYGLVGVAIGTLVANVFRTVCYSIYISKIIISGVFLSFCKHLLVSIVSGSLILLIYNLLPMGEIIGYGAWFIHVVIIGMIAIVIVMISDWLFYKDELFAALQKVSGLLNKIRKTK